MVRVQSDDCRPKLAIFSPKRRDKTLDSFCQSVRISLEEDDMLMPSVCFIRLDTTVTDWTEWMVVQIVEIALHVEGVYGDHFRVLQTQLREHTGSEERKPSTICPSLYNYLWAQPSQDLLPLEKILWSLKHLDPQPTSLAEEALLLESAVPLAPAGGGRLCEVYDCRVAAVADLKLKLGCAVWRLEKLPTPHLECRRPALSTQ